jgi:hypothetical protein
MLREIFQRNSPEGVAVICILVWIYLLGSALFIYSIFGFISSQKESNLTYSTSGFPPARN